MTHKYLTVNITHSMAARIVKIFDQNPEPIASFCEDNVFVPEADLKSYFTFEELADMIWRAKSENLKKEVLDVLFLKKELFKVYFQTIELPDGIYTIKIEGENSVINGISDDEVFCVNNETVSRYHCMPKILQQLDTYLDKNKKNNE